MPEPLDHLVVVIPGIGGSELAADGVPVWAGGTLVPLGALREPERLDAARELTPVGLVDGFLPFPQFTSFMGYASLWRMLRNGLRPTKVDNGHPDRRVEDATLVAFPYDFRHGVVAAADRLESEVNDRLRAVRRTFGNARVVIVAHSMGGLVARHWLSRAGQAALCRGMVTVGTPHRGAPKALSVAVHGVQLDPLPLDRLSEVVRGWPGLFDLVPVYDVIDTGHGWVTPTTIEQLGFGGEVARAAGVHAEILDAWKAFAPERRPTLHAIAGRGHKKTPEYFRWTVAGLSDPLRRESRFDRLDGASWSAQPLGDKTVPFVSALPGEVSETPLAWTAEHTSMHNSARVVDVVAALLSARAPTLGDEGDEADKSPPVVQMACAEVVMVGDQLPLDVSVSDVDGPVTWDIRATLHPEDDVMPSRDLLVEVDAGGDARVPLVGPVDVGDIPGVIEVDARAALSDGRVFGSRELVVVL